MDQRTTRKWRAVFGCSRCHVEAHEGVAQAAEEEDDAMEQAAVEGRSQDLSERQAQVQFDEEALLAGAIDEPEDDFDLFNTSFNSPLGSPVEYKYPSTSTLPDEERLEEKGPHRCKTNLEALSALASRTGASHAMAALLANGGYNDRGLIGAKITLDQGKVLRSRIKWGDTRTLARLAKALRMDAIYFD